jgi:hypothetical protein
MRYEKRQNTHLGNTYSTGVLFPLMSCIKYEFETTAGGLALAEECNRRENLLAAAGKFLKIGCNYAIIYATLGKIM